MFTAAQLRAARGLLDWTRADLAKASGLSQETIKNIEHGTYKPQESTIDSITKTFTARDVEFLENEGVRKNSNAVINYVGRNDFRRYADDVYDLLLKNPEHRKIYIFGNNDEEFVNALGEYAPVHLQRMSKLPKLEFKALVLEDTEVLVTDYIEYRRLPNISFAVPFSVYENRFDFILYGEEQNFPKVVAIKSQAVADAYRAQFQALWRISKPIN
jgi:transcriptional regulator with XRE-family HTH domain